MLTLPVKQVAVTIFWSLVNDAIGEQVHKIGIIGVFDFIQVSTGNVNLYSPEEVVEIAINTCIRKDRDNQLNYFPQCCLKAGGEFNRCDRFA
ncbi:hypothetical protein B4U84_30215 [Westiellopsis prolifica IICB1]|nr:hypothetical protein B4U84_30215 [Westiellopsis prolifica IICB1]